MQRPHTRPEDSVKKKQQSLRYGDPALQYRSVGLDSLDCDASDGMEVPAQAPIDLTRNGWRAMSNNLKECSISMFPARHSLPNA